MSKTNISLETTAVIEEGTEQQPEDELDPIEITILRIRVHLNNMIGERARHGMQQDDTASAIEIASDALRLSKENGDEIAVARVSFWLGVALYYSDDAHAACSLFKEANRHLVLPTYEAGYIEGWIDRCNERGPEKDATAYGSRRY